MSESRRALGVAEKLLMKLIDGEEKFDEKDLLNLKHLKEVSALIAKLVPLVKIQEPYFVIDNRPKKTVIKMEEDKALLEDFVARKISERLDGDRLNNPE